LARGAFSSLGNDWLSEWTSVARLELKAVRKSFQSVEVIHGIDLTVERGSFTVFVGPSGCGKSTLLRMIAGLEDVTDGEILLDGRRCDHLLPSSRGMAMVFQSYALYPHMSVHENLRFGLVCQRVGKAEIAARIARAADILQIAHLLDRQPAQLSGGQSQRVAIGRAIVKEPKAFLFDEPLSNLDAELRVKMRSEIAALHRRLGTTMVYVTHDQVEAMTMADSIVVLREGTVEQVGSPIELYSHPRNRFVACFLGAPQMNILAAASVDVTASGLRVSIDRGRAHIEASVISEGENRGSPLTVGLRPEHLTPSERGLRARVEASEILGAETIVHCILESGERLDASLRGLHRVSRNELIGFEVHANNVHVFDAKGNAFARNIHTQVETPRVETLP
jgi:multiple sugar transport system ATP-binding protein